MARLEDPRRRLELERDRDRLAGDQRLGCERRASMTQVEEAAGDECRRAVGEDAAELGGERRDGRIRGDRHLEARVPEDLEVLVLDRPVVDERETFVGSLIRRLSPRQVPRARDPRGRADVAAHRERVRPVLAGRARQHELGTIGRRPGLLGAPATAVGREVGLRVRRPAGVDADGCDRLRFLAVAQPTIEPGDHLGHEIELRTGDRSAGGEVGPRPDEQAPVRVQRRVGAERVVAVAVGPATDDHGGGLDALVALPITVTTALPQRPVPPVRTVPLLFQPAQQPRLRGVEALTPRGAPLGAGELGRGWQRVHRGHVDHVVDEVDRAQGAARVVDVVGVAVVARVDRDDRGRVPAAARRRPAAS